MTDSFRDKGTFERAGGALGGLAGMAGDTAVNLMGSMLGSVARTVGGWWSDRAADEALTSFGEKEDSTCRAHFDNVARRDTNYDTMRPLYQFGHLAGQNPDYQGRSFEEVETDLKTAWTGEPAVTYGDWEMVRDYMRTGFATGHDRG
jgi:hypothetical protein